MEKRIIVAPPPFTNGKLHLGHYYQYSIIAAYTSFLKSQGFDSELALGFDVHGLSTNLKIKELQLQNPTFTFGALSEVYIESNIIDMLKQFRSINVIPHHIWSTHDFKHKLNIHALISKARSKDLIVYADHLQEFCPNCCEFISLSQITSKVISVNAYEVEWTINSKKYKTITTQPELLPFAKAMFYNPSDSRYLNFDKESVAHLPYLNLQIPVLPDERVSIDLGTGLVFVAAYGSKFDYDLLKTHNLLSESYISEKGLVNNIPFAKYTTCKLKELLDNNIICLIEQKLSVNRPFHSERSNCNKEVVLIKSKQLYIQISKLKTQIQEMVSKMNIWPQKYVPDIIAWIETARDWCISRNYLFGSNCFINSDLSIFEGFNKSNVLPLNFRYDCWIDSSISWLTTQQYFNSNECFVQFQGYEIIRTWLFYSLVSAAILDYPYPFKNLKLMPLILGKNNKKLSKSNPEQLDVSALLQKYEANVIRIWAILRNPHADSQYNEKDLLFARKFIVKLKNIKNFIKLCTEKELSKEELPIEIMSELSAYKLKITEIIKIVNAQILNFEFHKFKQIIEFVISDFSNSLLSKENVIKYRQNHAFISEVTEIFDICLSATKSLCQTISLSL